VLSDYTVHDCELYGRAQDIPALVAICRAYRSQERVRVAAYDIKATTTQHSRRAYLHPSNPFTTDTMAISEDINQFQKSIPRLKGSDRIGVDGDSDGDGDGAGYESVPKGSQDRPVGTLNPMIDNAVAVECNGMFSTYSGQNASKALRNKSNTTVERAGAGRLQADAYSNSYERDREKSMKNKPKSGGIYGLLLKSGMEGSEGGIQGQHAAMLLSSSNSSSASTGRSVSIELPDLYDNMSHDSSGYGTGLMKSSPISVTGTLDDSPSILSNRDDKGRGTAGVSSYSSAQILTPTATASRATDITHGSSSGGSSSGSTHKASPSSSGVGLAHQRPKSAFGRSSIGASPSPLTAAPQSSNSSSSSASSSSCSSSSQQKSNDSVTPKHMYRSHSSQKMHRDATQELKRSQSTPKIAVEKGSLSGAGGDLLSKEPSPVGTRSAHTPMKYSSSGRVTPAHSSSVNSSSRCGADVGVGASKVPPVFRLLEHSVGLERAASVGSERSRSAHSDAVYAAHQTQGSSVLDDDDESVMTLASTAVADGPAPAAREGSVRQSLMLLKARKKSLTSTPRLSRQNSAPTPARGASGRGQDEEKEEGLFDEYDAASDDHSARTSRNACSGSSRGSDHGSFDTSGALSVDPWGTSSTVNSRAYSNKSTLLMSSSRDMDTDIELASAVLSIQPQPRVQSRSLSRSIGDTGEVKETAGRGLHSLSTHPCPHCGRNFASEPLSRHTKVCSRIFSKKRRVFDSVQMRGGIDGNCWGSPTTPGTSKKTPQKPSNRDRAGDGTGAGGVGAGVGGGVGVGVPLGGSGKWRAQSEMFRESIKAVKVSPGPDSSTPLTRSVDPTLVPCPHCCRR
jgi:zinc-finger of a C2HC-type